MDPIMRFNTNNRLKEKEMWQRIERTDWPESVRERFLVLRDQIEEQNEGETVTRANYYTPRLWKNEYDRGSARHGFCLSTHPGHKVFDVQLENIEEQR